MGFEDDADEEVKGTLKASTPKAILLELEDGEEEWFPKSQILDSDEDPDLIETGESITIAIPGWLAREKMLTL